VGHAEEYVHLREGYHPQQCSPCASPSARSSSSLSWLLQACGLRPLLPPFHSRVRWTPELTSEARMDLERRFSLRDGAFAEGTTWAYRLSDYSRGNIRN
jgi:hypothetical protein